MKIAFHATLRPIVGGKTVEVPLPDGSTIMDLVAVLIARWPALEEHMLTPEGCLSRRVSVFVDGRNARWLPEREVTRLAAHHEVAIFPPVAGG